MKKLMKKVKSHFSKKMMKDESGQGMLEYILLVVVVVGLVMFLKEPLKAQVDSIKGKLEGSIGTILQ